MTLQLSERDRATLVVALRAWQNELNYYTTEELRNYYPDLRGIEPLTIDEVEDLLAQVLASHGSGEATVSTEVTGGAS